MTDGAADVVVVGGGNAALCAALAARDGGARVALLEKAPEPQRGGNSFFTAGGFRFVHGGLEDLRKDVIPDLTPGEAASVEVPPYTEENFYDDLMRLSENLADQDLADVLITRSRPTVVWMRSHGIRWILMFGRQSFKVGTTHRFWGGLTVEAVGGGPGLVQALYDRAAALGIEVRYETKATRLLLDERGAIRGLAYRGPAGFGELAARAVVLASGGFEANPEWRTRYLGQDWELARVRGTRHNTGDGIRMALEIGAQPYGHWSGCHAVAWDLNAPPFGDRRVGDLFQKHSYPLGVVVNVKGERFLDEGADFRNYTYAKYGREILKQPQRAAFQIFDQKTVPLLREEYRIREVTKAEAGTIEEVARKLEIDAVGLVRTVREFNAAVQPGPFNPAILDGKCTKGITPPKSNWALPLDSPPFVGYAVTCGITFTFGGLRINTRAEALDTEDRPIPGLYAAGELVGGLFYHNYPGGAGLMAGAVFGMLAGEKAATYSKAA
ncbi:MAG: FAD-dependent tricarballylate dehydrogenase TcuA [Candidatus Rokubacteria bacterium]|nr:FAD-dependent tricarballylate dehydrogenase TcuA [Candidatus Rokubacteria bacterium]